MENLSTIIICALIAVLCVIGGFSFKKRLKNGCCGGGGGEVKEEKKKIDKEQYPYHYEVGIEGMSCHNCSDRIELAVGKEDGLYAEADWRKKKAMIWADHKITEGDIRPIITRAGYKFVSIKAV